MFIVSVNFLILHPFHGSCGQFHVVIFLFFYARVVYICVSVFFLSIFFNIFFMRFGGMLHCVYGTAVNKH